MKMLMVHLMKIKKNPFIERLPYDKEFDEDDENSSSEDYSDIFFFFTIIIDI